MAHRARTPSLNELVIAEALDINMTVDNPIVTRSRILTDLRSLGLFPGATLMLHASVKSVGHIVGGPDVLLDSILEAIGEDGTLMMYVGWEDNPYNMDRWSSDRVAAYEAELAPFCAATSRADRAMGTLWAIAALREVYRV